MNRHLRAFGFLLLAGLAACSESPVEPVAETTAESPVVLDGEEQPTIADIVVDFATAEDAEFTILLQALQLTGLDGVAAGERPLTVFAPTDEAFRELLEDNGATLGDLVADTDLLRQILLYHVLPGAVLSGDVLAASELVTAQGGSLFPELRGEDAFILDLSPQTDDAQLQIIDVEASNGVIHVIDEVLFFEDVMDEEEEPGPTIADIVVDFATAEDAEFTILLQALQLTGLDEVAAGERPLTVFAPTDEAFRELLEDNGATLGDLVADTDLLRQILLYHVLPGAVLSGDVLAASELVTAQGGSLFPELRGEDAFILDLSPQTDDAQLQIIDVEASNGVIHVIDEVLFFEDVMDEEEPGPTIADIVVDFATAEDAEFTILLQALQLTGLDEVAAGERPLTVFAPTDEAFRELLEDNGATLGDLVADTDLLRQILLYHVLPGAVLSGDVLAASELVTAQGGSLFPELRGEDAFILDLSPQTDDAQLQIIDVEASNGVIHVIDEVLFFEDVMDEEEEPGPTIADIVVDFATAEDAEFTILLQALQLTGLDAVAAGERPLTVFAPTDEAFRELLEDNGATLGDLVADTDLLRQILLYHVLPGAVLSGDVLAASELVTAQGGSLFPELRGEDAFILDLSPQTDDAQLQIIDVEASNGVIHVIDEVLFFRDAMR